jgi:hypothetical protein
MTEPGDEAMWTAPPAGLGPGPKEYRVVDLRATGVAPGEVANQIQQALDDASGDGWVLQFVQPIIYNSSTTGYLILIFGRERASEA